MTRSTVLAGSLCVALLGVTNGARGTDYVSAATGTWGTASTWSPAGTPTANDRVTILSGHTITISGTAGTAGSLTINAGGGLKLGGTSNPQNLTLAGSFTNNGTLTSYTGGGACFITFSASGVWVGSGDMSGGKIAIVVNPGVTVDISGLSTPVKYRSAGGTPNQVNGTLVTGTQIINANGNTGCTFTLGAGGTIVSANLNGLLNGSVGTFNFTAGTVTLSTSGNYTFNGSAAQVTTGMPTIVNNLTIDNSAGVSLSGPVTVNGTLTLGNGKLTATGANLLSINASGTVAGASSSAYVVGSVNKAFNGGSGQLFLFPIGDSTMYAPLALANLTVDTAGWLTVGTTPAEHPSIGSSGVDATRSVNRYWTASTDGVLAASTFDVTLNFVASDVDAGANPANFVIEKYRNSSWVRPALGLRTSTSTTATGLNSFGAFAAGEPAAVPATLIQAETAADGSGIVVPAQNLASGSSMTLYAIARAADNSFVGNVAASWSLSGRTGGVANGDLSPSGDGKSATFTGHVMGTATVRAASGTLTPIDSGTLTVVAGPAVRVQVETAADGSGAVVPAQTITSGATLTAYAVSRDAASNFVANVAADAWTMENETGGVTDSNLSPTSGTSSIFTANLTGSGNIHASVSGLISVGSGLLTVVSAQKVWSATPANHQWDTISANWTGGLGVFNNGDPVQFTDDGSDASPILLTGTLTPSSLTVNASNRNYTFAGSGYLSGTGGLVKSGTGTLILANSTPNDYSGSTLIQNGTLQVGAGDTAGSLGTGPVTNNGTLRFNCTANLAIPGPVSGSGTLEKLGGNLVTIQSVKSYSGPVVVNGGQLALENSATATLAGNISGSGDLGKGGGGTMILTGNSNSLSGQLVVSGGTLQVGNADNTGSLPGGRIALLDPTTTLFINTSNNVSIAGEISGAGKLSKRGWGVLTLSDSNSFTGPVTTGGSTVGSEAGVIRLLNSYALGGPDTAKTITVCRGELDLEGGITLPVNVSFNTSANGALVAFRNVSGTNAIEGNITLTGGGGSTEITAGAGRLTLDGTVTASTTGRTLILDGAGEGGINGPIINSGANIPSILVQGPGKWTLAGTNTYTGTTTVSNGTLLVSGTIGSGGITVASAGRLGGTGTLGGNVTNNGTLAPGVEGIGTLSFSNAPALLGTLVLKVDSSSVQPADKLLVLNGPLAYGGTLVVTNIGSVLNNASFTLFSASSYSGTFETVLLPPGGPAHWKTDRLAVDGTIQFTNNAPVASDITLGVARGETVTLAIIGGKHAPTDLDGDSVAVVAVGTPSSGSNAFTATSISYTASGSEDTSTFTYTVADALGATDVKTVTVLVSDPRGSNQLSAPVSLGGGVVALSYAGIPGYDYALDCATNLTPPILWLGIATNTAGPTGMLNFTNTVTGPANFFRTRYVGP